MSFDLQVFVVRMPGNLLTRWQSAFLAQGMDMEFRPDFEPSSWPGGDLVARIQVMPHSFLGWERFGEKPFATGCGAYVHPLPAFEDQRKDLLEQCSARLRNQLRKAAAMWHFTTSSERSLAGHRFQWFAAALLASLTVGVLLDPQEGKLVSGRSAPELAVTQAENYEAQFPLRQWRMDGFRDWKRALKDADPPYEDIGG